jgi:CHAT domain-containing protein
MNVRFRISIMPCKLPGAFPIRANPFLTNQSRLEALIGLKRYDAAQQLADEILKQARLKRRTAPAAQVLPLSSRIALARGNTKKAVAELEKAIAVCKVVGLQQMRAEPEAMLAEIYRQQGNLRQAEYYALAAAKSTQESGDKWSIPQRLQTLAELQASRGRYNEADRTYEKAAAFIDSGLANSSTVLEKTALIKASSSLYSEHFSLVASRLHSPLKAYSIVEQVRGRVTADLLMAGSVGSPKAKDAEHAISRLQLQLMSADSAADVNRLRRQIFTVQESRWVTPGVSILKRSAQETISAQRVRRGLDRTTAILEYVIADPQSYCLVISNDGVRVVTLASQSKIDRLATAYLKAVRQKLPAHVEARQLFDALFRPIREAGEKQNLVIIRDGQLHLLPFDALEDPSGRYVGDSHIVAYAPSVTSFYVLSHEAAKISMHPLLAVGGLPYSQTKLQPINFIRGEETLRDLPYSKQEILAANSAIAGKNNLLLGAIGTESAFKHATAAQYGIVHLAVHGFPDEADPEQASLALLPDRKAGEDGFLHASEIAMMHLDTNLVVLSACDTAVGPIQGEEGIATLSKAFLLAGARAVVSTLWSADDTSSLFLMERFYSRIAAGDSPAAALTKAKRALLRKFGKAAVPYYWAGFTFEGVPTPTKTIH